MARELFPTFNEAFECAKFNASKLHISIKHGRVGDRFYVDIPDESISYEHIPEDFTMIKKTERKVVVKTPYNEILTLWKDEDKKLSVTHYGTETRDWERHTLKVTNDYYKK